MKAKRIQKDINSVSYKGFIPSLSANSSMINLEEINSKSEEKNTEVLAQKLVNQISMPDLHETSRSAHKTPINSKLKAAEIQKKLNEKIQTSFQHKIKQSVQEAKLKRRNLHQSQTPKTPANLYSQRIVLKKLK